MDPAAGRIALLTLGMTVATVGLAIFVVGLTANAAPILGFAPGVPQVLLGAAVASGGAALARVAWDLGTAEGPSEEE